jgi:TQXA domain-containing protein
MNIKKYKHIKFIAIVLIFTLIAPTIFQFNYANTENLNFRDYQIYSYKNSNIYIKYNGTPQKIYEYYYINNNGNILPAYCMTLGLKGAETVNNGYSVCSKEYLTDTIANNIILNGYPYKNVDELHLLNENEARYATQFALWIYLNSLNIDKIEAIDPSYIRVVDAIKSIYKNGTSTSLEYSNDIQIEQINEDTILDDIDTQYYSKTYTLNYGNNVSNINISINGIDDYIITDEYNNPINNVLGYKKIKILFPRKNLKDNIDCTIDINCTYKESAVLFAKSKIDGMQDVSLSLEPLKTYNTSFNLSSDIVKTVLIITKKDLQDENIVISNVKFNIYDLDDNFLGQFITDENGTVKIDIENDLNIYNNISLKVKEVDVPYPYTIDENNNIQIVNINVGTTSNIEFKNSKIINVTPDIPVVPSTINNTYTKPLKTELPKTGY